MNRLPSDPIFLVFFLLGGCTREGESDVRFVDRAREAGIDFVHTDGSSGRYHIAETLASGVGVLDYDGDGDLDIYLVNGRPLPPGAPPAERARGATVGNALYRNDGPGPGGLPRFTDVTASAGAGGTGFGVGCCAGDFDADGDLDIFVAQLGPDALYRNNGDGTFTDVARTAGVADPASGACAAFGDVDGDGHLDLYVSNYCEEDYSNPSPCCTNGVPHYCAPVTFKEVPDSLFINNRDGTFRDASAASGIRDPEPGQGMGVCMSDLDDDGLPEIYVANDGSENFLFQNLGGGRFQNVGLEAGVALDPNGDAQGSMGVDLGDFDGDALLDLVVTNYQRQANSFYRNDGPRAGTKGGAPALGFRDQVDRTGVGAASLPMVGWGVKLFDHDHDGVLDLFVANGHLQDRIEEYDGSTSYLQENQLFRGLGGGRFRDVTREAGDGLAVRRSSRGAAFGDIDRDGDVDVVVSCSRDRPLLLLNQGGNRRSWVQIELLGKPPNRHAIGARVTIEAAGRRQVGEVRSGGSYGSQSDLRLHFGLGGARSVDRVEVRWPGGKREAVSGIQAGRLNRIEEGAHPEGR